MHDADLAGELAGAVMVRCIGSYHRSSVFICG
jgi:hypothetical protein